MTSLLDMIDRITSLEAELEENKQMVEEMTQARDKAN
jgi:hypothetical protein